LQNSYVVFLFLPLLYTSTERYNICNLNANALVINQTDVCNQIVRHLSETAVSSKHVFSHTCIVLSTGTEKLK